MEEPLLCRCGWSMGGSCESRAAIALLGSKGGRSVAELVPAALALVNRPRYERRRAVLRALGEVATATAECKAAGAKPVRRR